jgi:hypothetical protein
VKKGNVLVVGLLLVKMLTRCDNGNVPNTTGKRNVNVEQKEKTEQTEKIAEKSKIPFTQLKNLFGFANVSAKNIITLVNNKDEIEKPEEFNIAVGDNGKILEIEFERWQESNSSDDMRQTSFNFDSMIGHIYKVKSGQGIQDKTYFLSNNSIINKDSLIELKPKKDSEPYGKVDAEIVKRIEDIKSRKIIESSLISETTDNAKIFLFVFERKGDDMLASVVYIKDNKIIFKDYPAKYDETSTWRVDAGDRPGSFEVMFLANSDKGLLLGMTWGAPEGEGSFILREERGTFQETDLKSGRYWLPK